MPPVHFAASRPPADVRLLAGAVFVVFGAGKFVNHSAELASFQTYGLPAREVFVIAVGVLELVGGIALIVGRRSRLWAAALASGRPTTPNSHSSH